MRDNAKRLDEIERRLCDIETALRGSVIAPGDGGALQNLIRVMRDLYEGPEALKVRVSSLEKFRLKTVAWATGAFAGLQAIWFIIQNKFIK